MELCWNIYQTPIDLNHIANAIQNGAPFSSRFDIFVSHWFLALSMIDVSQINDIENFVSKETLIHTTGTSFDTIQS